MHNTNVIFTFLATAICAASGQSLSNNDIPPECRSICQPVVAAETRCDNQFDDDDGVTQTGMPQNQQYRDCVCQDQGASQALATCDQCVARYPNFFIDQDPDNDDGPGPEVDDNEVAQWARICGLPVQNGTSPSLTAAPTALPTSFVTSMSTVTQTYDCDDPNDVDDTPDQDDGDDDQQCTRTTVVPVVGIATGIGSGPMTVSGAAPSGVSVSFTTSTSTDASGNAATFTSAVATFTGAAALPTAAAGYFGAGAAALVAAFAL